MTWSVNIESPQGEAILDAELPAVDTKFADDAQVALRAADGLVRNSEDGAQRVTLNGYDNGTARSITATVQPVSPQAQSLT